MELVYRHRLVLGVATLAAVLIGSAAIAWLNLRAFQDDAAWVSHTQDVLESNLQTLNALVDAETGERGFLITGDEQFLEPYKLAITRLKQQLSRLSSLTADNALQQARLNELTALAERRLALLERGIALGRAGEASQARELVLAGAGKAVMDQARRSLDDIRTEELRLLALREERALHQFHVTSAMILAGTVCGLAALLLLAWLMQRHLTERARAAIALAEQREWFRTTLASIGDAVITSDISGKLTYQNPVAQALTGWPDREAFGRSLAEVFRIVNEETRTPAENPAERALREGRIVGLANHTVLLTKDGREIPIDDAASPIRDEQGRISGVVLIFRDITESRRAQHALAASETRFRQLAETVPHMIWVADESGTMQYVNARYRAYFGWTTDESIRHETMLVAAHTEDREQMMQRWRASLTSGEQFECAVRLQRASDGAWRWHLVRSASVREPEGGKVSKWFGSATDVHEQRMLQMRLAEEDRRKDEFLAVLAHELRNPLAPIRNALEILRVDPNVSALIRHAREVMQRQLHQLVRLVDDLLDVSRIRQGKIELRLARLDLTEVLNLAVEACRPLFDAGAHEFVFAPPAAPIALMGDQTRLSQAIQNILNNAAKFTASGGRIELHVEAGLETATIRIRDEGRGIGAAELPYIFEMFAQGQKRDTAHQGLGIGLNLARRLIEMHGGRVSAASRGLSHGSEFTITLPAIAAEDVPAAQKAAAPRSPTVTNWSILIVDDNADSADTLSMLLSARGHKTHVAYDGAAALEAAARTKPDVVLLDIGMPGIDGYEVARRLREIHGLWSTLIVAQTGWGQERDRDVSRAVGFDHHLVKPIDPAELEELLSSGRRSL